MNFIEQAYEGKNNWWRYVLTVTLLLMGAILGSLPLSVKLIISGVADVNMAQIPDLIGKNVYFMYVMLSFVVSLFSFLLLFKVFHKRSLVSLFTNESHIRWQRVGLGIAVWGSLMLLSFCIAYVIDPASFEFHFNRDSFGILVLLSLIFIPMQVCFEEVFFRGYVLQTIGKWTKYGWVAIILSALLFTLMHLANTEVGEYGIVVAMSMYLIFGLCFGLITVLDNGIELSVGCHFINNFMGIVLLTEKASSVPTDALFYTQKMSPVFDVVSLLIVCILSFLIFAKKYHWNKQLLIQKIQKDESVKL